MQRAQGHPAVGDDIGLQLGRALLDPHRQFNRDEVALLMSSAYRWGYEARVTEEDQQLVPIAFSATDVIRDLERALYRKGGDGDARSGGRQQ